MSAHLCNICCRYATVHFLYLFTNLLCMLSQNPEIAADAAASKSSHPSSQKASVDLGQSEVPEALVQHRKLNLLPQSKPTDEEATPASLEALKDGEGDEVAMSELM